MVLAAAEAATQKQKKPGDRSGKVCILHGERCSITFPNSFVKRSQTELAIIQTLLTRHALCISHSKGCWKGQRGPGLTIACYQVETIKEGSSPPLCKLFTSKPHRSSCHDLI